MIQGDIIMHEPKEKCDFKAIGQAIKAARENKGWTRERVADLVDLAPRYIMSIENKGPHPSFQVFYELVTLFDISVDQYLFSDKPVKQSMRRRQLDAMLDSMSEKDLIVVSGTVKAIQEAKEAEE
jgi:transcriptional regulator with XRE-family HTH domain